MNATELRRTVELPWATARERVIEALSAEGFGVLSEIDVQATLKKKIDVDMPKYAILGACNPPLAHQAISALPDIGVMLPCNVIVYEEDDHTVIAAVDPRATIASIAGPAELRTIADDVRARLVRVLESVS